MPEKNTKAKFFEKRKRLFGSYFCAPKAKSTSQARTEPEILSTSGQNPPQTRPEKPGPTYNSELNRHQIEFLRMATSKKDLRYLIF